MRKILDWLMYLPSEEAGACTAERIWLAYRPALESFVILDDDDFWDWKWMSDKFVRTAREAVNTKKPSRWRYEKGLDREFAQRAVEILNR